MRRVRGSAVGCPSLYGRVFPFMSPVQAFTCFSFLLFVFSFPFCRPLIAQAACPAPNGVFLEAGGAAPYYSLSYARCFFAAEKASGHFRIGGSVWGKGLAIPVGASIALGAGAHRPELSLVFTPFSQGLRFWDRDESDLFLDLLLGAGYRYQPVSGSFFVTAGLFPYLRLDPAPAALSEGGAELRLRVGAGAGWFFGG